MKFKLDENLGERISELLATGGHDVETVRREGLQGSTDDAVFDACCRKRRCLVTLDLDFSDVRRFPPHKCGGIAIFRLPHGPRMSMLEEGAKNLLDAVQRIPLAGNLWVMEPHRLRIHQSKGEEGETEQGTGPDSA